MKNREWLRAQSEYDLLCRMQRNLEKIRIDMNVQSDYSMCIMHLLGAKFVDVLCMRYNGKCEDCIQAYLNEERR